MKEKKSPWYCGMEWNSRNVKSIDFQLQDGLNTIENRAFLSQATMYTREPFPERLSPRFASFKLRDFSEKKKANLGDFFLITGGLFVISKKFRDLLGKFELGTNRIYDLPLYEYDKTTLRPEKYYLLNLCEQKNTLVPEHSTKIKATSDVNWARDLLNPDEFCPALNSEALSGADLWSETRLRRIIFLSDDLRNAIQKEKIKAAAWELGKCKIVSD